MNVGKVNELADFLSTVPFFAEVASDSLLHLCESVELKQFRKNEVIFEQGETGHAMFVVMEGRVKVYDGAHVFGELEAKDSFGEFALIDQKPRSASVKAVEATTLIEINRERFMNLLSSDHGLAKGILAVMIKRHRDLDIIQERLANSKEELETAHAKMKGLIDGAMDAIIMFDDGFRIILTNPSANLLLENDDPLMRNVLFFLKEEDADRLEQLIKEGSETNFNTHLKQPVMVIGSDEKQSLNEGTLSRYGSQDQFFYTLILRNLEDRIKAEDTINLLTHQTEYLAEEIKELTSSYGILAEDPAMLRVIAQIDQVADTDATVLITGETGTGKELVARGIHRASDRNDKPLIRINCGAIPANLMESELFGHEKGAFTGATVSRKGRFLLADKGTIFLDEIGELPLDLQPKLLRVIQEGEFDPVGSSETIKVDVRIIAATHRDLMSHARDGKFREDLYYRLNVFPIDVPALRERGEDVCKIAEEMIQMFSAKLNKPPVKLSKKDQKILSAYSWPGNVRELQNLIERAVIVSQNGKVDWNQILPREEADPSMTKDMNKIKQIEAILDTEALVEFEKENLLRALRQTEWRISGKHGAAALLKMKPTTLASKIKALGISRPV